MKIFFDSSAFAKRYVEEKGSEAVEQLCGDATELGLSVICVPEIISALDRRVREGALTRTQYRTAKSCLLTEAADATIIYVIPEVVADAIRVLETSVVRAMDALHIGCALQWNAELFVSSDVQQLRAARKMKLRTKEV